MTTLLPASSAPAPTIPTSALPFHLLGRLARPPRWWRPLAMIGLTLLLFAAMTTHLMVALSVVRPDLVEMDDMNRPGPLAVMVGVIALMLPAALVAHVVVGGRPLGSLTSVAGRVRWPLLLQAAGVTAAALLLAQGLALVLLPDRRAVELSPHAAGLVVVVLLLVPFQAAAEEYVFRGLPMQALGAWLRHPAWGILLPLPLFVVGHDYSWQGLAATGVFGLCAGLLTWRSGGLELAIGLHVANNVLAFLTGAFGADLNASEVPTSAALLDIGYLLVTTPALWWVIRRHERRGQVLRVGDASRTVSQGR